MVSADTTRLHLLSDPQEIREAALDLRHALLHGESQGGSAVSPELGTRIRMAILEPFRSDLTRTGRYLMIPDGPFWGFSLSALPEQQDGRRFLADIRSIGASLTVSDAFREASEFQLTYSPDFLGLSPFLDESPRPDGLVVPGEMVRASQQFGQGLRVTEKGSGATADLFREHSASARYIHLADIRSGSRGSLLYADGEVGLHEIRAMDMVGQIAVITGEMDPRIQMRQVQAFTSAGVGDLVVASWLVDNQVRGKYLYNFYEARNRERTPVQSLREARQAISSGVDADKHFDPSWWGQYILYGRP